jgi:hypothetical protein
LPYLNAEQIRSYRESGYLRLPGVFPPAQVTVWSAECDRLRDDPELVHPDNLRTRFRRVGKGPPVLERYDPVVDVSPVFQALAADPRLTGVVGELLGEEPLLFKDKLIFKLPGMSGYQMHQDGSWWQGFPVDAILTAMVAIDGAAADNGALEVFAGYHDRLLSAPGELRNMNGIEMRRIDGARARLLEMKPGDVALVHSLTPHRSGTNASSRSRRQLYLTYSAGRYGDLWRAHREHLRAYVSASLGVEERQRLFFR